MKKTLHAEGEDYVYNTSCVEIMKEKVTFDIFSNFGVPGKWCFHFLNIHLGLYRIIWKVKHTNEKLEIDIIETKKRNNKLPAVLWGWSGRWRAPLGGKLLRFPPNKEHMEQPFKYTI